MSNAEKILERMRANPKADWRIEDCQVLARRFGVSWETTGSHATFRSPDGNRITVPARPDQADLHQALRRIHRSAA